LLEFARGAKATDRQTDRQTDDTMQMKLTILLKTSRINAVISDVKDRKSEYYKSNQVYLQVHVTVHQ